MPLAAQGVGRGSARRGAGRARDAAARSPGVAGDAEGDGDLGDADGADDAGEGAAEADDAPVGADGRYQGLVRGRDPADAEPLIARVGGAGAPRPDGPGGGPGAGFMRGLLGAGLADVRPPLAAAGGGLFHGAVAGGAWGLDAGAPGPGTMAAGGASLLGTMGILPPGMVAPVGATPGGYGGYAGGLGGIAAALSEG
eukprot:5247772-Karenia_brevis.AAC.1